MFGAYDFQNAGQIQDTVSRVISDLQNQIRTDIPRLLGVPSRFLGVSGRQGCSVGHAPFLRVWAGNFIGDFLTLVVMQPVRPASGSFRLQSNNAVEIEILSRLAAAAACDPCPRIAPRAGHAVPAPS